MKVVQLNASEFRAWREGPEKRQEIVDKYVELYKDVLIRAPGSSRVLKAARTTPMPNPKAELRATPPEVCHCKEYAGTEEGKHHPICVNRAPWEAQVAADAVIAKEAEAKAAAEAASLEVAKTDPPPPAEKTWMLVTEDGQVIRPATPDECDLADANAQEVGVRMVVIDDTIYHVEHRDA